MWVSRWCSVGQQHWSVAEEVTPSLPHPAHARPIPTSRPACLRLGEVDAVGLGRRPHLLVRSGQADHAGMELLDVVTNLGGAGMAAWCWQVRGIAAAYVQHRVQPAGDWGWATTTAHPPMSCQLPPPAPQQQCRQPKGRPTCSTPSRCGSTDRNTGTTCTPVSFSAHRAGSSTGGEQLSSKFVTPH